MLGGLNPGLGLAILRIVLAVIFLAHGVPKLAGGMAETARFWADMGFSAPLLLAWCIALLETLGGVLLLVGYLVSPASFLLILQKTVGLFLVHLGNGFFVTGPGEGGIEFNLLIVAGLLTVLLAGPGLGTLQGRLQRDIEVL